VDLLLPSGAPWTSSRGLTWRTGAKQSIGGPVPTLVLEGGLASREELERWHDGPAVRDCKISVRSAKQHFAFDFTAPFTADVSGVRYHARFHTQVMLPKYSVHNVWQTGQSYVGALKPAAMRRSAYVVRLVCADDEY